MRLTRVLAAVFLITMTFSCRLNADDPKMIDDVEFEKLIQLIKPQAGESRWMEIDWHPNVWEARRIAAAEGKPIFLMAGSGGAPAAGC